MPLIRIPSDVAVQNRKNNPFAAWGDRGAPNRVEPIALPSFDVPFKLESGEPIFTVGSCFARNVEAELAARGFQIPARALFRKPEFVNLDPGIINNYGTPSIYNEFAWAFGEREFVAEHHVLEVMPGKFADQHVSPSLRPEPRDVILARRAAITQSYRTATSCRTVIMTLGLSEVWFDTLSGYYLNVSPRPSTLKAHPGRYELHVLSFEEAYGFLKNALLLLQRHGPKELRVLLTVSPVPLQVTQRPVDVMVANTYSKSVLRTAAETAVAELPFVSYYPSYESVILSDRKMAWLDDMIHVTETIVRTNVRRMVDAFVGGNDDDDDSAIAEGGETAAVMRAQSVRTAGGLRSEEFFARHAQWSEKSVSFALEHARFLIDTGAADKALDVLCAWQESGDPAVLALQCEALLAAGKKAQALAVIDQLGGKRVKSIALWDAIFRAALATADPDLVVSVLAKVTAQVPARKPLAYLLAARFFRDRGDAATAIRYFSVSVENTRSNLAVLELADLLVSQRRLDEARQWLNGLEPANAGEATRLKRLTDLLGPMVGA
ncbi:MAG: GSCFA domain-containing protein [Alphaproteobacteria bacterium]|nr:GSCFA domain-containing protein [Alphaproteobacteria bacterium]